MDLFGQPFATVSIWLEQSSQLPVDVVYVKDAGENVELVQALVAAGCLSAAPIYPECRTGLITANAYRLGPRHAPVTVDETRQVFFEPGSRVIYTTCTKCNSRIQFRLGSMRSAEPIKNALRSYCDQPLMCPPLADGGFAVDAHPELNMTAYWQLTKVLHLIDLLVSHDHLAK